MKSSRCWNLILRNLRYSLPRTTLSNRGSGIVRGGFWELRSWNEGRIYQLFLMRKLMHLTEITRKDLLVRQMSGTDTIESIHGLWLAAATRMSTTSRGAKEAYDHTFQLSWQRSCRGFSPRIPGRHHWWNFCTDSLFYMFLVVST